MERRDGPLLQEKLFVSSSVCVCVLAGGGLGKQLHLLLRRTLPQLMISDDIIKQSAHKQMLEALPKQCQLRRAAFEQRYYLYRTFKFVMLMTPPLLACRRRRRETSGPSEAAITERISDHREACYIYSNGPRLNM